MNADSVVGTILGDGTSVKNSTFCTQAMRMRPCTRANEPPGETITS